MVIKFRQPNKFKDYMKINFIQYAIVLILLIFVLFIISMCINFRLVVVRTNESYNSLLSKFINEQYIVYNKNIESLAEESSVKNLLMEKKQLSQVNNLLYDYSNNQEIRSNFVLLDKSGNIVSTNLYKMNQTILQENRTTKDLIAYLSKSPDVVYSYLSRIQFDSGQDSAFLFAKAVTYNDDIIGYLLFFLKNEDFKEFMRYKDVDIAVITDRYDNVIFSTNSLIIDTMGKFKLNKINKNTVMVDGKPYFFSLNILKNNSLRILTMTSIKKHRQFFIFGTIFLFGISFFMVVLVVFLSGKMTERNLHAFDSFIYAVDQCKKGNIDYRIESKTFDEFQRLYDEFNNMMSRLQRLIRRNNEIAERKRIMEIKHLESQFNPHFVFNVLEMLRYEILFDPNKAADMVVSFANLMRYNINYGSIQVALKTDIEYMKAYLALQKMRYNRRLNYNIDVDEKLLQCKVPKLVFQPIVENSLKHGVENTKCLNINVTVKSVGKDMKICVEDDGLGIKKEKLSQLRNILEDENSTSQHIGLYNVHRVIKLLYGEDYGLTIDSNYGIGTKVTLKIPIQEGN